MRGGKLEEARLTLIASTRHSSEHGGASRNLFCSSVIELMRTVDSDSAGQGPSPARLNIRRDRLRHVVDDLERAVEIDPLDRTTELLLARVLESIDEPVRARKVFQQIDDASIADPGMRQMARKAIAHIDQRIAEEKDPLKQAYFKAQQAEQEGRTEEAIADYRAGLAAHPDRPELLTPLAGLLADQGKYAEAADLLGRATRSAPGDAALWFNLGLYRGAMEDRSGAVTALRRASTLSPEWPKAHLWLARALERVDDLPGAISEYERFRDTSRGDSQSTALAERRISQLEARKLSPPPQKGTPP